MAALAAALRSLIVLASLDLSFNSFPAHSASPHRPPSGVLAWLIANFFLPVGVGVGSSGKFSTRFRFTILIFRLNAEPVLLQNLLGGEDVLRIVLHLLGNVGGLLGRGL